jgi:Undecaprenyl-phosphate glucose phosphotransferase
MWGAAVIVAAFGLAGLLLRLPLAQVLPFALAPGAAGWACEQLGLYRPGPEEALAGRLGRLLLGLALGSAAGAGLALALGALPAEGPRLALWTGAACAGCGLLHLVAWAEMRQWSRSGRLKPNVVVVGATAHAERLIRATLARRDMHVLGVFDDRLSRAPEAVAGVPVLGDVAALIGHRILPHVDRIVLALDPSVRAREIASRLAVLPYKISLLVDFAGDSREDAALARIAGAALSRLPGEPEDGGGRLFTKRLQDLVFSAVALVVLSPLLLLVALAVKLDSPGPVFFRQRRHGFNNEEIVVWKFRTMRHDPAGSACLEQVRPHDPRITRVGGFLRAKSLDELPQLLNVLSGEMSIVGPRPHAVGMTTGGTESAKLVAEYAWRHRIKPGLTGWAAINGSRGPLTTAEDVRRRVGLDLEYIERQSFWFDLWIILKTVPCLLGDGIAVR